MGSMPMPGGLHGQEEAAQGGAHRIGPGANQGHCEMPIRRKLHFSGWPAFSMTLWVAVLLAFFDASGAFIGGQFPHGLPMVGTFRRSPSYISPAAQLMLQRNGASRGHKCGCLGWGKGYREFVRTQRSLLPLCSSKSGSEVGDTVEAADSQFFPPYTDKIIGRGSVRSRTKPESNSTT
jgi:hypothetical protein